MERVTKMWRKRHRREETEMGRETDRGGDGDKERQIEMWRLESKRERYNCGAHRESRPQIDEKLHFLFLLRQKVFLPVVHVEIGIIFRSCSFYEFKLELYIFGLDH